MFTVEDLMTRDVVTLKEDDNLARADDLLALNHIRHLPVVRDGRLVGLISHRDLLRALAGGARDPVAHPIWVRDVMTREVETVGRQTPLREVVFKLLDHKFGCLPVVERDGRLVGILTESDFVRLAGGLLDQEERRRTMPGAEAGL